MKNIKLFLLDMDGTIYLGNRLFDFSVSLLDKIKMCGKKYIFITNNSSKNVEAYVDKLAHMGIHAEKSDFLTSSQATAIYLKQNHPNKTLYVCGTESLKNELAESGFELTENTEKTECIVMGFDTELTFKKLDDVSRILSTRDIPYIATNPDYVCPTEYGFVPDCGSVCDMIFNATKKRPVIIGKPSPLMVRLAMEKEGAEPYETAVVGDRIYTDIKCGINAGAKTVLVLSGETDREMLENSLDKPDFVFENAGEIMKYI